MQDSWQKYVAEAFATFAFVFLAAGSVLANWQTGSLGTLGIAVAHGLALAAMIYAVWHISGAHLNPAVTVALWATGHVKTLTALGYIVAQLVGSVVAALFLKVVFADVPAEHLLGTNMLGRGVTPGAGILVEALLTFFLVWTVFGTLVDKKGNASHGGLMVGFVLTASILVGGYFTMGALNPARVFGPALVSASWANHFVYWVGPLVGALMAAFVYHFGFIKKHAG